MGDVEWFHLVVHKEMPHWFWTTRYLSWDHKRCQLLLKCLAPDFFLANVFAHTLGYGMWLKQVESVSKTAYTCTLVIDNT